MTRARSTVCWLALEHEDPCVRRGLPSVDRRALETFQLMRTEPLSAGHVQLDRVVDRRSMPAVGGYGGTSSRRRKMLVSPSTGWSPSPSSRYDSHCMPFVLSTLLFAGGIVAVGLKLAGVYAVPAGPRSWSLSPSRRRTALDSWRDRHVHRTHLRRGQETPLYVVGDAAASIATSTRRYRGRTPGPSERRRRRLSAVQLDCPARA